MTAAEAVPEHLHDRRTGQHLTFLDAEGAPDHDVLRVKVRLEPGGAVPKHAHLRQDERVAVAKGKLEVRVGRRTRVVSAGETCDVPRRKIHVVRNASAEEASFVLEVRPARRMERAMRALFATTAFVEHFRRKTSR